jgi:hypothetical protein
MKLKAAVLSDVGVAALIAVSSAVAIRGRELPRLRRFAWEDACTSYSLRFSF